jgi:hypothetical protein
MIDKGMDMLECPVSSIVADGEGRIQGSSKKVMWNDET